MNERSWLQPVVLGLSEDSNLLATAFALLLSFSISIALVAWATDELNQARSASLQQSINEWQLRHAHAVDDVATIREGAPE